MRKLAAVLALAVLTFWFGTEWGKRQIKAVPAPVVVHNQGLTPAKIYLNGRFLHVIYQCQINWLAAHQNQTLPSGNAEACTNEDLDAWNRNMADKAESH